MISKKLLGILISLLLIGSSKTVLAKTINHTVTSGDTLWKLSKTYKTTVDNITNLNNLDENSYLDLGQILKINDNRGKHTVASGDSLWKISQRYSVTVNDIKEANNLTSDSLDIGQVLIIPDYINHTVVSGESLWKISQKYSLDVAAIKELNNLVSDSLDVGQDLILPEDSQISEDNNTSSETSETTETVSTTNHTVAPGENLWIISEKYNTSMDAIIDTNMLASDILMPGQILTVPVDSTEAASPVGITMMKERKNDNYGDLYTWENARRIFTVSQEAVLIDLEHRDVPINVKYYGGSNHADIVTLTTSDTDKLKSIFGDWSWSNKRPMVLKFFQGGTEYQLAVSVTALPHGTTDIYTNGLDGHLDMYFYNSTSHNNNTMSEQHQQNVLKANGQ